MDTRESAAREGNTGMTDEGASDWFSEKALADMAVQPEKQEMILSFQNEACARLSAIIDETAALLMQDAERSTGTHAPVAEQQPLRIGDMSKRRRQAWEKARELAEMLVIGALLNKDNPAWDPADPSTCAAGGESALLSLVRFDSETASTPAV